ncbi:PAAR domain-containing protein [Candidatus Thiodiazotropha sp. CDECU1]|uniref:PAAR domain-containing protein n=1 Tax=Candidatus Thiodiazotropha sp. CDECU1 TaxID=3065865 RepID=UPI002931C8F1|nr:PAAR domain-containing protein [Candidatus Thiodiazotropha sp. CDECU1]
MSGKPAARVGDMIFCSLPQVIPAVPPVPHAPPPGLPIIPPGALTVLIGGKPAARMGDMSLCVTPVPVPNPIVRGAFPVPIMNMPAARMTDSGTHPGSVIMPPCCPTVLIGLSGVTGNPRLGNQACQSMAAGRSPPPGSTDSGGNPIASNTPGQSYNNCGIESSRQIVQQATGANPGQEAMMNTAIANSNASQAAIGSAGSGGTVTAANQAWYSGGTTSGQQASILTNNGVPSSRVAPTSTGLQLSQLETALSQGRGVIANGDVSGLPGWGTQTGAHAVTVTGYEYDDAGNITHVIYNDTGIGACNQRATAAQFQNFLTTGANNSIANGFAPSGAAVTNNPIW